MEKKESESLQKAAKAIHEADAIFLTAGAGLGVDSGMPDFRGPEGFWRAYPPLKKLGLVLSEASNSEWFTNDPEFAWGFFGHRYNLYSSKQPHEGFQIMRKWAESKPRGYFIFTSNVDGHFQKAGFAEDRIVEVHGSIHFLQCHDTSASKDIWPVPDDFTLDVDEDTLRLTSPLPQGPPGQNCTLARPNILMFGDWGFLEERTGAQESRFYDYQTSLWDDKVKFVVIEIGAGLSVPTVQYQSECLIKSGGKGTLIRINPSEPEVPNPDRNISLPMGGLKALTEIDNIIQTF